MPPVAMFRRAGSLLALLLAALSFSAPSSALATDSAPLMPEASARSGLKLSSPAALAAGRFKFDGEPEAAEDEPAADVAPRPIHNVDKSEYAMPTTLPPGLGRAAVCASAAPEPARPAPRASSCLRCRLMVFPPV